jgi:hypothetical protein
MAMNRLTSAGASLILALGLAVPAPAQTPPAPPQSPDAAGAQNSPLLSAEQTRAELNQRLRKYPPSVAEVLRLSPSLASEPAYLQAYPALSSFLAQHPEVTQNPAFYFGAPRMSWEDDHSPSTRRTRIVSQMLDSLAVFAGLMTLLGVVAWLLRSMIDHQRWKRALKVQADAHARLVERLTTTEEVLAYSQTPAGRHFLESGAPIEAARRQAGAPIARILWSVQMGTVIALAGLGVFACAARLGGDADLSDLSPFLFMLGAVAVSVGVGFLLSALIAFFLSRRLGLLEPQAGSSHV